MIVRAFCLWQVTFAEGTQPLAFEDYDTHSDQIVDAQYFNTIHFQSIESMPRPVLETIIQTMLSELLVRVCSVQSLGQELSI